MLLIHYVHFCTFQLNLFSREIRDGGSVLGWQQISPISPDLTGAPAAGPRAGSHLVPGRHHQPPLFCWKLNFLLSYSACPSRALNYTPEALLFIHFELTYADCSWTVEHHWPLPVGALWWWAFVLGKQSNWFPLGRLCLCRWLLGDWNCQWHPELSLSPLQRRRKLGGATRPCRADAALLCWAPSGQFCCTLFKRVSKTRR